MTDEQTMRVRDAMIAEPRALPGTATAQEAGEVITPEVMVTAPRTFEMPAWRTTKPASVWDGSMFQVPAERPVGSSVSVRKVMVLSSGRGCCGFCGGSGIGGCWWCWGARRASRRVDRAPGFIIEASMTR